MTKIDFHCNSQRMLYESNPVSVDYCSIVHTGPHTLAAVVKTPHGRFWMGNSQSASYSMKDLGKEGCMVAALEASVGGEGAKVRWGQQGRVV